MGVSSQVSSLSVEDPPQQVSIAHNGPDVDTQRRTRERGVDEMALRQPDQEASRCADQAGSRSVMKRLSSIVSYDIAVERSIPAATIRVFRVGLPSTGCDCLQVTPQSHRVAHRADQRQVTGDDLMPGIGGDAPRR